MQDNKLIKSLVLNAQLGNNSAFEQLYQITIDQIFLLILRLTGNQKDAEILTKKTYVNAWVDISKKDELLSFTKWLKRVAARTVIEEKSRNQKPDGSETIEHFAQSSFENCIIDLGLNEKLVFILHDVENFSIKEISQLIGLHEKEVKNMLINTREQLIRLVEA